MKKKLLPLLAIALATTPAFAESLPASAPVDSGVHTTQAVHSVDSSSEKNVVAKVGVKKKADVTNSQDAVEMAEMLKEQFFRENGVHEGRSGGKCIAASIVMVEQPVAHADFERFRILAFRNAEANALASMVKSEAVSVTTMLEQRLFDDSSSDARNFEDTRSQGRTSVGAFIAKVQAVAEAKLDALLRDNGIDPHQFRAYPADRKKELAAHTLVAHTTTKALKTLSGVSVLHSFSTEDDNGYAAVCVILGSSPKQEAIADGFKTGKKTAIPLGKSTVEEIIPQRPEILYSSYGTRVVASSQGPALLCYGLASYSADGDPTVRNRKRAVAYRQADVQATDHAVRFLSQSLAVSEESKVGQSVRDTLTQAGSDMSLSEVTEKAMTDIFKGAVKINSSALLTDFSTWNKWKFQKNGKEIVGVVKVLLIKEKVNTLSDSEKKSKIDLSSDVKSATVYTGVKTNLDMF